MMKKEEVNVLEILRVFVKINFRPANRRNKKLDFNVNVKQINEFHITMKSKKSATWSQERWLEF